MKTFQKKGMNQKSSISPTTFPGLAQPSRPFVAVPVPGSEQDSRVPAAQLRHMAPVGYSIATLPLFPSNKENTTGLPDILKTGIENLSGISMDDVHVHYNSPKPAQVQALAYTQGPDIHVDQGQEKHLPHEAWHVVQQVQGRVKPTARAGEMVVNDEQTLESEADLMGAKAGKAGQQLIQRQAMLCLQDRDIGGSSDRQRPISHKLTRVDQPAAQQQVIQRTPKKAIKRASKLKDKKYQSWEDVEKDRSEFNEIEWAEVIQEYYDKTISRKTKKELSNNEKMYNLLLKWIMNSNIAKYTMKDVNWQKETYTGGGQCQFIAAKLREHYKEIDAEVINVGAMGTDHSFVVVKGPLDEQFQTIIDPTWKQFPMYILRNTINDQLKLSTYGDIYEESVLLRGAPNKEDVEKAVEKEVGELVELAARRLNELPHVFVGSFAKLSETMQIALEMVVTYYLGRLSPEGIIKSNLQLDVTQMSEALQRVIRGIYIGTREKKPVPGRDIETGIKAEWTHSQVDISDLGNRSATF